MEANKPFKILSIDGGGIKGLYSASVIARLEEKTGKKSADCFDMICGTSTGGLIALGLASGHSAEDLQNLYYKKGNSIFPTYEYRLPRWLQRTVIHFFTQTFFFGKFSNKNLKKVLVDTFGETRLGDLDNLVCIPSFNLTSGMPRMFKFPHKEGGFYTDKEIPLVDAALATTAAPTFFPIHEYDDTLYIDGGVWANNPSMCGLLEAIDHFIDGENYTHVEMLSIGSISKSNSWTSKVRKRRSFIGWKSRLIETSMDGQAYFTHFFLKKAIRKIDEKSKYVRISSPALSSDQMEVLEMDRADKKALSTLRTLGRQVGAEKSLDNDVTHFYETTKTYYTK